MALNAGTVWEVRTTGDANNGGGFFNRIPGTSVDYSQQNASQLSPNDLACVLATAVLTSVTGGFTAAMVGSIIQIRAGGVNFTPGFYEILSWNSVNSVNLDRTPVAGGNGIGGLGEVGGALASIENTVGVLVAGNVAYIKSGTYNHTANRTVVNDNVRYFGYDTARSIRPIGNNRPLLNLAGFYIQNGIKTQFENIRMQGSGAQLILQRAVQLYCFNCRFENTAVAGTVACIYCDTAVKTYNTGVIDCEFLGAAGADNRGYEAIDTGSNAYSIIFAFCFFHDLFYGFLSVKTNAFFFKNTFARMGFSACLATSVAATQYPFMFLFNSFYNSSDYHVSLPIVPGVLAYGNTFESAGIGALRDTAVPDSESWFINNNDFWNNGADVIRCLLDYNNIGLNPLFVNPAGNDFNFGPGSPNIDQALGIRLGV